MTHRITGIRMRFNRTSRLALVLSLIAALLIVALPAEAAPVPGIVDFAVAASDAAEGVTTHTVEVTLSIGEPNTLDSPFDVDVDVVVGSPGTATDPDDYTYLGTHTVSFLAGETDASPNKTITIDIVGDALDESDETIELVLANVTGTAAIGTTIPAHTVTILDDDDTFGVAFDVGSSGQVEGDAGTTNKTVAVELSTPVALVSAATVDVSVTGGTAAGSDYSFTSPTPVTFPVGSTDGAIQNVTVEVNGDTTPEPNETVVLGLSGVSAGGSITGITSHTLTITNDDSDSFGVAFDVGSSGQVEGDAGTTNKTVAVELSTPVALVSAATVDVSVTGGTAAGSDYSFTSPTPVTFPVGSTDGAIQNVTVEVNGDSVDESNETVVLGLSGVSAGGSITGITSHTLTITDDDTAAVTIAPVDVAGAESPSNTGSYTVVLTSEPTFDVTVTVAADAQVSVNNTSLVFTPLNWFTPRTVIVTPTNDTVVEGTHPGVVSHSASGGGYGLVSISDYTISIADDDFTVAFTSAASSGFEGTGGTSPRVVTVVLDTNGRTLTTSETVQVERTGGTATPDADFTFFPTPQTVIFPSGSIDGTTQTVTVNVVTDALNELTETVILGMLNPSSGGTIVAPAAHTIDIVNDDVTPGISVLDAVAVAEGPSSVLSFRVVLSPASGLTVTVNYATANGTAVSPDDYAPIAAPLTLTFLPGEPLFQDVLVTVADDAVDETTETVLLNLSSATNTTIADAQGVGSILDNDNAPPVIAPLATTDTDGNPGFVYDEGETVKVRADFTDPGLADTHSVTIDWGDGTAPVAFVMAPIGVRFFERTHVYPDEGFYQISVTVADADGLSGAKQAFVSVMGGAVGPGNPNVALVDPATGIWRLYNADGNLDTQFYFGVPGDYPFMGDWDGDGIETPGLYRQSDGFVYLRSTNTQGPANISFFFGNPGDVPLAGDFNGDGFDTVSIYRPSNQTFYIINELGKDGGGLGSADTFYVFGNPGDKPFVGDFDGDGIETAGLHRESTGLVYFRNSHTTGNANNLFIFGDPGDRIVADDWTGDGFSTPALYRASATTMFFRYTNTQGIADHQWTAGQSTWLPVSGVTGF